MRSRLLGSRRLPSPKPAQCWPRGATPGTPALPGDDPRSPPGTRHREQEGLAMSVVLAGGGTAGHIEPALAVADALRRADPRIPLTCLGTQRGLETRLVPLRGYDLALIPPVPLPRRPTAELLSVPGRL